MSFTRLFLRLNQIVLMSILSFFGSFLRRELDSLRTTRITSEPDIRKMRDRPGRRNRHRGDWPVTKRSPMRGV